MENMRFDMKESLDNYVEHGLEPGGFLTAVLENNLMEAFGRADMQNKMAMQSILSYVYNSMPSTCWGSPEHVGAWLAMHRKKDSDS